MKILSAKEIRAWDQFTIENEPIASIDLMERAATVCTNWLEENGYSGKSFKIFCGKGNNGGDGLAIARILAEKKYPVHVSILDPVVTGSGITATGHKGTSDFQTNLTRLREYPQAIIQFVQSAEHFHHFDKGDIIIDALFGSGLNRGLEGITASLVNHINESGREIISIDIPSGMFVDRSSKGQTIVRATHTLSFQCYKPAFLVAENAAFIGEVHIVEIGLHPDFYYSIPNALELTDKEIIHSIYKPRNRFAHKGNFGHALLVVGSYGKMGAAILSAKACMKSGTGLLSCHIPECGYEILQVAVPEAMVQTDHQANFNTKIEDDLTKYEAIGIGPGIGMAAETKMLLREVFDAYRIPIVLDADALNIIASQKDLLKFIPGGSILTPHLKEFDRLFGETGKSEVTDFDRIQTALQKANELNIVIVLKGHYTLIATPAGKASSINSLGLGFFNPTGNAGMATAGSGDVLTGILTGLLAQGYSSVEAAILGVYLHGLSGDIAAEKLSQESMIAGDIIENLGNAFLMLQKYKPGS